MRTMAQRDLVLRWIRQAARVIARLLRSDQVADLELARLELESAMETLLGNLARVIPALDAGSACALLHDAERILGYARLLALEAALLRATGDATAAARLDARAEECSAIAFRERPDLASETDDGL